MPEEILPSKITTLDGLLNYISYGSHFMLEYDGSSWNENGQYGTWHAQFYDGHRESGSTIWEALTKAWASLPNKPNPFMDIRGFKPDA